MKPEVQGEYPDDWQGDVRRITRTIEQMVNAALDADTCLDETTRHAVSFVTDYFATLPDIAGRNDFQGLVGECVDFCIAASDGSVEPESFKVDDAIFCHWKAVDEFVVKYAEMSASLGRDRAAYSGLY